MHKTSIVVLCIILVFFSFSQTADNKNKAALVTAFVSTENNYKKANHLADNSGEDEVKIAASEKLFRQTLSSFHELLVPLQNNGLDSLFLIASLHAGIIYHYFDSLPQAKAAYLDAIRVKEKLPRLPDSLFFQPFLFAGSVLYSTGQFDSALLCLNKAEAIRAGYSAKLGYEQRLYNLLGALNYETGNLNQSMNYVEKAIENMKVNNTSDLTLLTNYQLNIASILIKLERFTEAEQVLTKTSRQDIYTDEINHKLGYIYLKTGRNKEAIRYFDKVKYANSKKIIDLMLNKSKAYGEINEPDSSAYYLLMAKSENLKWNGRKKNISNGIIFKQEAEALANKKQYVPALSLYQQSILQFSNTFTDTAAAANPESFSGIFAFIDLFNILTDKGDVLKRIHDEAKDIKYLEGALNAYRSAFMLAAYVEKTYDSDEARLFLGKIKHTIHSKPIDISLELFDLSHNEDYLEEAYLFDQRNKASVLTFNIRANELRNQPGEASALVQKEALLKSALTRLSLKAAVVTDSVELQKLYSQIRDNEIELGSLQEKINTEMAWQKKSAVEQIPSVGELQKKLDPTTTLLSYHLSENELLILLVSANQFEYHKVPVNKSFFTDIESLKTSLHSTAADGRYDGSMAATSLYRQLILPIQSKLQQKKRLIIIPDDELNYLPFEALQDESKRYLVEKFSIQYQFCTALATQATRPLNSSSILAFAPFASGGYEDAAGDRFSSLPASKEETSQLKGNLFVDAKALKSNFLLQANHYSIIHLATHASVNNEDPMRSFIAFYPGSSDYKLYAQEIYDLNLDSLQLIILSACETGSGQLIKGEGLMSLSRAFTYAGCPNIITSLWKAEDKTTAFITSRLHYYLGKKYTKDHALQQAKIDLLNNTEIDPRLKAPSYWAHLVFIGNYEADHTSKNWWWVAITIIAGAFVYKLLNKKKAPVKG